VVRNMPDAPERCLLVGVFSPRDGKSDMGGPMEELALLTRSAGGEVVQIHQQKREAADKKFLIGRGKAEEIKYLIEQKSIRTVIFHNPLTNVQQRNLENFFEIKVIDRTRLILDVFATRARTLEGKLQVELAQLWYMLPRLTGRGAALSRLGGGIGTRGPGETKLEADRRRIQKRITLIKHRLKKVGKNRDVQRKQRRRFPVPVVSLVGYTSAGKSTLFKALTGQDVAVSEKLFSTLDPLMRRVDLGDIEAGYYFLLSDTVGFIRDMPKELFRSFRATLEEVVQSDVLLHVVDLSRPDYLSQKEEVERVLRELGIPEERVLTVFNKTDLLSDPPCQKDGRFDLFLSARTGEGIDVLKRCIFTRSFADFRRFRVAISNPEMDVDSIHQWAILTRHQETGDTTVIEVLSSPGKMIQFIEKYGGKIL